MKKILDNYLEKMEKYLRPVPVSEPVSYTHLTLPTT